MAEVWIVWLFVLVATKERREALREQVRPGRPKHVPAHRRLSARQREQVDSLSTWNRELAATGSDIGSPLDGPAGGPTVPALIYEEIRHLEPAPLDDEFAAPPVFDLEILTAFAYASIDMDLLDVQLSLDRAGREYAMATDLAGPS